MELASQYPAYGHPMIHDMIRKEWPVPINHKRTERLYNLEELSLCDDVGGANSNICAKLCQKHQCEMTFGPWTLSTTGSPRTNASKC